MKPLSPLAAAVLSLLTQPMRLTQIRNTYDPPTTTNAIGAALDELTPDLVTRDEHEGVSYFYRRNADTACARAANAERRPSDPMAAIRGKVAP